MVIGANVIDDPISKLRIADNRRTGADILKTKFRERLSTVNISRNLNRRYYAVKVFDRLGSVVGIDIGWYRGITTLQSHPTT